MDQGMTPAAAKELGRAFRFVRQAHDMTLRDAAKVSGVSVQYILNIEQGSRSNISEDVLRRMGQGYQMAPRVVDNMLLKSRVISALERRGLDAAQQNIAWKRLETTLIELGVDMQEGVREMVSALYGG